VKLEPLNDAKTWWHITGDHMLLQHIAGLRGQGVVLKATVDQAAVAAKRAGIGGPPPPSEVYNLLSPETRIAGLRDYQTAGVGRLAATLRLAGGVLLADDMGLGKTVQTIATWNTLKRPVPLLVIAPASVRRTWLKEFSKWAADAQVVVVESGKDAKAVPSSAKIVITSYELAKKLGTQFTPHMIVMDEAHLLRGRTAERSNHLYELAKLATFRLALTGTPMWSRPRDFWMLLKILFGYRFGTADEFDAAYCGLYINEYGGKENKGATRLDELRMRLNYVMLRRLKEEVSSELPPLTRQMRWVPATKEAKLAVQAAALKQMPFTKALETTLNAKMDIAIEAAQEAGKFLLFTWQKQHAEHMHEKLTKLGHNVELLDGDWTPAERQVILDRARKTGASVVATLGSSAAGVDGLQEIADTCIFHALSYVPIEMAQAEARLHRIGQKNPVTVVYLAMEDSADQYVVDVVINKLDQWRASMGNDSTASMVDTVAQGNDFNAEAAALSAIYDAMEE
jgi:SWI/SNF-related matrix-associated actin-dependent regulator 1 of chromatin subfamily A